MFFSIFETLGKVLLSNKLSLNSHAGLSALDQSLHCRGCAKRTYLYISSPLNLQGRDYVSPMNSRWLDNTCLGLLS